MFFDSLDSDGDGAIEPEEVAVFLRNEIGGEQFDTLEEVDEEVGTIMERLDRDHDNGLEMSDMIQYWIKLETLLTAEEVSDWIMYSVQLPSSVGEIFLENGITGYDFLEIVDNGGQVLRSLGVKASFRNKIVRQMQARMLGIGSSPGLPERVNVKLENCKAVTLSWEPSTARVFPVHSYRIQRRAINLFGNKEIVGIPAVEEMADKGDVGGSWEKVYVGSENEFVDAGLETGHNYMYRIQAWNSVGRSGWQTVDITRALKKQGCSTRPSRHQRTTDTKFEAEQDLMSIPKKVVLGFVAAVQIVYHSVKVTLALFALIAGIRRASATSSASAKVTLPFLWFWKTLNRMTGKLFGKEWIPKAMLGDKEALKRQEQMHEEQMLMNGLRGYERLRKKTDASNDRLKPHNVDVRATFKIEKSCSTGDLTTESLIPRDVVVRNEGGTPNKFPWLSKRKRIGPSAVDNNSQSSLQSLVASTAQRSRTLKQKPVDQNSKCSECDKQFRFGRYKHHCCHCMAIFCHKHGRTTHSNFTSCRVPGDCICNSCLRQSGILTQYSNPPSGHG